MPLPPRRPSGKTWPATAAAPHTTPRVRSPTAMRLICRAAGVGLVFAPEAREMYLPDERTRVRVQGISDALCGASRPGHFEGVATIVTKLFAVAGPCAAVFGRKDYQQLKVIERLTRDLLLPVRIVAIPARH